MPWRKSVPTPDPGERLLGELSAEHARWLELLDEFENQLTVNRAAARSYHEALASRIRRHLSIVERRLLPDPTVAGRVPAGGEIERSKMVARALREALATWEEPLRRGEGGDPVLAGGLRKAIAEHERWELDERLPLLRRELGEPEFARLEQCWKEEGPTGS
jgi:hypothetical protein